MALTTLSDEETLEFGWWLEIVTALPECTYYFGSFANSQDACFAQIGYFEDLKKEGPKGLLSRLSSANLGTRPLIEQI